MKIELGIGILMLTCLSIGIGSCEKVSDKESESEDINEYALVADSIRNDSTISNGELIAVACESLFDKKYLEGKTSVKITKKFILDQITIVPFNGNNLIQINYEDWGPIKQHSVGLYLLDTNMTTVSNGIIVGTLNENPKISIVDWNKDKIQELQVNLESTITPPDVVENIESIHSFDQKGGLKELFRVVKEYRNCSSVMDSKWNYSARSYAVLGDKVQVTESNYLISCEEFERTGKISKLRKVSSKSCEVEL